MHERLGFHPYEKSAQQPQAHHVKVLRLAAVGDVDDPVGLLHIHAVLHLRVDKGVTKNWHWGKRRAGLEYVGGAGASVCWRKRPRR